MRRLRWLAIAFFVFGCKPAATTTALAPIESVRERFNASSPMTRVLALLSPT